MLEWMLTGTDVYFNIFADGSPSSGFEQFVCVENATTPEYWCSRLLLVSVLHYGAGNLTSKVFAILWKMYVETGPNVDLLRWRLWNTRIACSDQGTEGYIANALDCLNDFLMWIGSPLRAQPTEYLFPLCICSPGWHHRWDHVLEEAKK